MRKKISFLHKSIEDSEESEYQKGKSLLFRDFREIEKVRFSRRKQLTIIKAGCLELKQLEWN